MPKNYDNVPTKRRTKKDKKKRTFDKYGKYTQKHARSYTRSSARKVVNNQKSPLPP